MNINKLFNSITIQYIVHDNIQYTLISFILMFLIIYIIMIVNSTKILKKYAHFVRINVGKYF